MKEVVFSTLKAIRSGFKPERHRYRVTPGDWVCLSPDTVFESVISLRDVTMEECLEREAFTGRPGSRETGWIQAGSIALVLAVKGDEAYLWSREGCGYGWIDRQYVCSIHELPEDYDSGHESSGQEG